MRIAVFWNGEVKKRSGLCNFTGFEGFDGYPDAFDMASGQDRTYALQIWLEGALVPLCDVHADAAASFGYTFSADTAAPHGAFTGDCTYSGHNR